MSGLRGTEGAKGLVTMKMSIATSGTTALRPGAPHVLVRERMSTRVVTLPPTASVADALDLLEGRTISAVPILDREELVGIVSTTDLVAESARHAGTRNPLPALEKLMTWPVITTQSSDTLDDAARKLVHAHVHRLVVVDDSHVVGVLSARDILKEVKSRRVSGCIGDVMTTPAKVVSSDTPIEDAIMELARANVHGLVVVEGDWPIGVFTHAEALAARWLPPDRRAMPVESVMSFETFCLDIRTPIHRAAAYAISMNVRRILVVEGRRLCGIASCIDLVESLTRGFPVSEQV